MNDSDYEVTRYYTTAVKSISVTFEVRADSKEGEFLQRIFDPSLLSKAHDENYKNGETK